MNPNHLIEICRGHNVYIQTHNFPDPDAISSAFGLQKIFENFGITSTICYDGQIDKLSSLKMLTLCKIDMHPYEELPEKMNQQDLIILVDCQKENGNTSDFIGDEVASIDHHPTIVPIDYQYFDRQITGACASIIAHYFKELFITPDVITASALLYGIRMDTLQLSRGITQYDIDAYSFLFPYSDQDLLRQLESNNMEFTDLKAYGEAIEHICVFEKIGFSYVDFECPDALVATLAEFILSLNEVELAVIYAKRNKGYKFSIRSNIPSIHAGELAHQALQQIGNGGGHASMAGGYVMKQSMEKQGIETFEYIQELFMKTIRNTGASFEKKNK